MDRRIGAQYYTIKNHAKTIEEFDTACKKVSEIGYKIVQISGVSHDAKEMREILDKYGLQVVTSHRSYDDFLKNLDEIIDYNKILGCDLCGIGAMPEDYRGSDAKTTQFIKETSRICEVLKKENMYFGYHNHTFEFVKDNGVTAFERMMKETDPEIFNFILDTYWLQLAGKNPAEIIRQIGKQAMVVHFKDVKISATEWKTPLMGEIGYGNLDWDSIIESCEDAGVRYAIVEQDRHHINEDPFLALDMSYRYLTTKGFI